ncbi:MAG: ABC transporter ATP-binding protein [Steroidobacteraceae bacterium]
MTSSLTAACPLIQLRNVSRDYGVDGKDKVQALKAVTLTFSKGEFVAIAGQSGSGKSTLLAILGCLDQATSGRYIFEGRDVAKGRQEIAKFRNKALGMVFQSFHLLHRYTVLENVSLPARYGGLSRKDSRSAAAKALELVGVGAFSHRRPMQLSGGQQQRVAVARALVNDPPLVLADEPTGNLDSGNSEMVMALFKRLNREHGKTIILVTHDQEFVRIAQRVVKLKDGRISMDDGTLRAT